ncbi:MAG: DUF6498-containing protein [Planctomycetota bacterium]
MSRTLAASPLAKSYVLDASGFAVGLGLAIALQWKTADLVWGLWLSSLVIGWAALLFGVFRQKGDGSDDATTVWMTKLFVIAFFTVHFFGFHFVHSIFLTVLFPIRNAEELLSLELPYAHVFSSYWPWLIPAAIAERRMFSAPKGNRAVADGGTVPATEVARRGKRPPKGLPSGFNPMLAYKNVIRMHLLIFALVPMQCAGIADSWSYALVYAVYFWPRRTGSEELSATSATFSTAAQGPTGASSPRPSRTRAPG